MTEMGQKEASVLCSLLGQSSPHLVGKQAGRKEQGLSEVSTLGHQVSQKSVTARKQTLPLQDLSRPFALHCFRIASQHRQEILWGDILQRIGR